MEHIIESQARTALNKLSNESKHYIIINNIIEEILGECQEPPSIAKLRLMILTLPKAIKEKINIERDIPKNLYPVLSDIDLKYIEDNNIIESLINICGEPDEIIRYRLAFLNLSDGKKRIACGKIGQAVARKLDLELRN